MALLQASARTNAAPLFTDSYMREFIVDTCTSTAPTPCEQRRKWRGMRGVTLIEILIVLSLVGFIGGIAAYVGIDSFRGYLFHSDRDIVVMALQHVRSQSVGNICLGTPCTDGEPHGIAIQPNQVVMFQGKSYALRRPEVDAPVELNPNATHAGIAEIVFTELSATTTGGTITITDSTGRTSDIVVSTEGQIAWTH